MPGQDCSSLVSIMWESFRDNIAEEGKIVRNIRITLLEKCPNKEFLLVRIFLHLDWIRRDTEYLSVFNPNAGKYRPEKTPYLDTFHAV